MHPQHGHSKLRITDELLGAARLSGKAAALGLERLWSAARITLTDNRRSMLPSRLMQLLKCKLHVRLLDNSVYLDSLYEKLLEDDLEFQSIHEDMLQFEEQDQIQEHTRIRLQREGENEEIEEEDEDEEGDVVAAEDDDFDIFADSYLQIRVNEAAQRPMLCTCGHEQMLCKCCVTHGGAKAVQTLL